MPERDPTRKIIPIHPDDLARKTEQELKDSPHDYFVTTDANILTGGVVDPTTLEAMNPVNIHEIKDIEEFMKIGESAAQTKRVLDEELQAYLTSEERYQLVRTL